MGEVRLVDLEIIKRYSLAIRQESAPVEEVLAVLDATRDVVAAAIDGSAPRKRASAGSPNAAKPRKSGAKKTASTKGSLA